MTFSCSVIDPLLCLQGGLDAPTVKDVVKTHPQDTYMLLSN